MTPEEKLIERVFSLQEMIDCWNDAIEAFTEAAKFTQNKKYTEELSGKLREKYFNKTQHQPDNDDLLWEEVINQINTLNNDGSWNKVYFKNMMDKLKSKFTIKRKL